MKFKKILLFVALFSFAFVLVACNETTTATETTTGTTTAGQTTTQEQTTTEEETTTIAQLQNMNILNGWTDSGDSVYTIVQSDTELSVTYDKNSFSWANMAYPIDQDLSAFNKLVISISGSGTLLIKIQGATEAFEVSIQLTAGSVTYQLNLRDYDAFLGGVTGVYLFGGPGKADDTGNFTITEFAFNEGTAYGNVMENGDSNIPENEMLWDGTGDTWDFSAGFVDNGDGIYTVDDSGTDPVVSYTKASGFEWAYLLATVGGDFSAFDYLVLTVTGTTAGSVVFKAELSSSVQAEISGTFGEGETITLCLDLSSWTNEQLDALTKILIFADGGAASGSGTFTINDAYFSKEYVGEVVLDYYDFTTGWTSNDAGVYSFAEGVDGNEVTFDKASGQEWSFMRNDFDSEDVAGYNTLTMVLQGTSGESILLKPNDAGALEQNITFDGTEQTVVVTADAFTTVLIFAQPGTAPSTGSFTILSATVSYVEPDPLPADQVYDMQNDWVDNDGGIYTFTNTDGVVTVDFSKTSGQEWSFIKNTFTEILSNHNTITITVQGTSGLQLIIKPNDNGAYEQTVTLDGTEQTFTFTLTDTPTNILIFVDPLNGALTGSFDIISATVTASDPSLIDFTTDFTENDEGTYAFTELSDGSLQVDYTKGSGQEWVYMSHTFNQDALYGQNTLTIVLQGTSGESILLKPNNDGALEQTITFDGTEQTFVIPSDTFTSLLIFAQPGTASVSGTFTILSAQLTYVEPAYDFTAGWTSNDVGVYTFTEETTGTTVDFAKIAGQEWSYMVNTFTIDAEGFNTLTIVLQGTSGESILLKPNNDGGLEQTVTFDGTEQTIVVSASAFTSVLIFAQPGTAPSTSSFVILSARLTYVEPDAVPAYQEVVLGNEWVDNDGGIYSFTDTAGVITVDFTKTSGQEWAYIVYTISDNLLYHDTLTMVFNGTTGQQLIVKPNNNGAYEQTLTFDGTNQTLTFTLTDTLTQIIIFVDPLNGGLTGSFDIVSAVVTSTAATYDFASTFAENDSGTYALTTNVDESVTVDYTKAAGQEWVYMIADFSGEMVDGLNTMTIVIQGTSGESILLKPNNDGGLEQTITFDGTEQTIVISATSFSSLLIFAEPGTASVSGSFTIISAVLSHVEV
ncbi:MAG: hypothetical protein JXL85_01605 [Bacilli bacterium]|nr:hypothetical protein [Bacilli bacterium]